VPAAPALPLSFRDELAPHVFAAVRAGWSVALVGPAGLGLSNLLRFLADARVAAHYLAGPSEAVSTLPVFVEADRWLDPAAVFPELARALLGAARAGDLPRAEQAAVRRLVAEAQADPLPAASAPLAAALHALCDGHGRRVLFFCDDFDAALLRLPGPLLRELRSLRDAHKYRLAYVLGLRREPARLLMTTQSAPAQGPPSDLGHSKFIELFDHHTFPVRPYTPADSRLALERKSLAWQPPLTPDEAEALHRLAGGHARLLIAALIHWENRRHLPWANVERGLQADPAVAAACRALLDDLSLGEQLALWQLAHDETGDDSSTDAALARLRLRGLAVGGPPSVFSKLLEQYLLDQPRPAGPSQPDPASRLRDPAAVPKW
jgi:hypothetical protein